MCCVGVYIQSNYNVQFKDDYFIFSEVIITLFGILRYSLGTHIMEYRFLCVQIVQNLNKKNQSLFKCLDSK